jgi:hypothetical protein
MKLGGADRNCCWEDGALLANLAKGRKAKIIIKHTHALEYYNLDVPLGKLSLSFVRASYGAKS